MSSRRSLPQRVSDSFRVIKDLDLSHRYETHTGTVVLLVLVVAFVGLSVASGWLVGSRRPVRVVAEFPAAAGLNGGDPVVVAGVHVGRVRRVELVEAGRVRVIMSIGRAHRPRRDAQFEILAVNMLGDVAVFYQPGSDSVVVDQGVVLAGRAPRDFASRSLALREAAVELAVSARGFFRRDFATDLAAAREATNRARRALAGVRGAPVEALNDALSQGQGVLAALDSLVAHAPIDTVRVRLSQLGENAAPLMAGVEETRERLAGIQARIRSGQGNVGLATRDSALRRELEATRQSLDHLLAKYLGRRPAAPDSTR